MINKNVLNALIGMQHALALHQWNQKANTLYDSIASMRDAIPPINQILNSVEIWEGLKAIFNQEQTDFALWVEQVDEYVKKNDVLADFSEIIFDLLMINFLSNEAGKLADDYFETDEWEQIEENFLDRGTEALNIFLYLQEAMDEEIEPDLDDFVDEFLLVDEEDFQDELAIYEAIIANRELIEEPFGVLIKAGLKLENESDLGELIVPMMILFKKPDEPVLGSLALLRNDGANAFKLGVLGSFYGFYNGDILQ